MDAAVDIPAANIAMTAACITIQDCSCILFDKENALRLTVSPKVHSALSAACLRLGAVSLTMALF
jgi:hypothetical protein